MNKNSILIGIVIVVLLGLGVYFQTGGGAGAGKGMGSASSAPAKASDRADLTPNPLDFGKVFVGQTAKRPVVFTNNSKQAATVVGFGTNDASFGAESKSFVKTVIQPAQKTADMNFTFTPANKGSFDGHGSVNIEPAGTQANKVTLRGEGVWALNTAALTIRPAAGNTEFVDFGSVKIGNNENLSVILSNPGTEDLTVQGVWGVGNVGFVVVTQGPIVVPAKGSKEITVRFMPIKTQDYQSAIVFLTPATPLNHAGIVFKGRGTQSE